MGGVPNRRVRNLTQIPKGSATPGITPPPFPHHYSILIYIPIHPPFTPEKGRNLNALIFDNPSRIFGVRDPSRKVPLTRLAPDWQIFVRFRRFFVRFVTFSNFLAGHPGSWIQDPGLEMATKWTKIQRNRTRIGASGPESRGESF